MSTILQCRPPRFVTLSRNVARIMLVAVTFGFSGCDSPDHTVDMLKKDIADFRAAPDDAKQEKIDKAFLKLDGQIEALEKKGESSKVEYFQGRRTQLKGEFAAAKIARSIKDVTGAIREVGDSLKEGAQNIGDAFKADPKKDGQ